MCPTVAANVLVSQWIKNPGAIPDGVLQQQVKTVSDYLADDFPVSGVGYLATVAKETV